MTIGSVETANRSNLQSATSFAPGQEKTRPIGSAGPREKNIRSLESPSGRDHLTEVIHVACKVWKRQLVKAGSTEAVMRWQCLGHYIQKFFGKC